MDLNTISLLVFGLIVLIIGGNLLLKVANYKPQKGKVSLNKPTDSVKLILQTIIHLKFTWMRRLSQSLNFLIL